MLRNSISLWSPVSAAFAMARTLAPISFAPPRQLPVDMSFVRQPPVARPPVMKGEKEEVPIPSQPPKAKPRKASAPAETRKGPSALRVARPKSAAFKSQVFNDAQSIKTGKSVGCTVYFHERDVQGSNKIRQHILQELFPEGTKKLPRHIMLSGVPVSQEGERRLTQHAVSAGLIPSKISRTSIWFTDGEVKKLGLRLDSHSSPFRMYYNVIHLSAPDSAPPTDDRK